MAFIAADSNNDLRIFKICSNEYEVSTIATSIIPKANFYIDVLSQESSMPLSKLSKLRTPVLFQEISRVAY
jgi:hypothetical protein